MSNNKDFKVKNGILPTSYQEGLGTTVSAVEGYALGAASYDSKSFSVGSQATSPQEAVFNADGTKMYVCCFSTDSTYQYSLSTAWDVSTASYDSVSLNTSSEIGAPYGLDFKSDGTKLYVLDGINDAIHQYSLSTAYDLSTASYDSVSFSVTSQASGPTGVTFKPDGTQMYVSDQSADSAFQYTLGTAWDISTASYASKSASFSSETANPTGLTFSSTGSTLFVVENTSDRVLQYSLSTAWDLSTASYSSVSFSVSSQEANPVGVVFGDSGTKMYITGNSTGDAVYQYSTVLVTNTLDLSTGSVFDLTPTSDAQVTLSNPAASGTVSQATLLLDGGVTSTYNIANAVYDDVSFDVSSQDAAPQSISFNDTGTKLYVLGFVNDTVYQYSLSTAYDVSTASYDSVSFSVGSQEATPRSVAFNGDGTKMYIAGNTNNTVYQYSLSTAFDLSTASYDSVSFSVGSQETTTFGISFNSDGTKMYAVGLANDTIYQYTLSTAYNVSTASYDSVSLDVSSQDANPNSIFFNSDGTILLMGGEVADAVYKYTLSTGFDLSTASYTGDSFVVQTQENAIAGIAANASGTKFYVVGSGSDTVHQYSMAPEATITYASNIEWPGGTAPTSPAIGETDVITFNTSDGGTTYSAVQAIDGAK